MMKQLVTKDINILFNSQNLNKPNNSSTHRVLMKGKIGYFGCENFILLF